MSVRKNGIYMTAKWDYSHDKVHFLYDSFECDTKQLESFKGSPIFIPEFQNPETAVDYEFVPLLEVLMSPDFVTDVKKVEPMHLMSIIQYQQKLPFPSLSASFRSRPGQSDLAEFALFKILDVQAFANVIF